jgi:hypothetical protein
LRYATYKLLKLNISRGDTDIHFPSAVLGHLKVNIVRFDIFGALPKDRLVLYVGKSLLKQR